MSSRRSLVDLIRANSPDSVADKMMRLEKLDGIGRARYADDLSLLNRTMDGIRVLP